jgi:hypothetical protein
MQRAVRDVDALTLEQPVHLRKAEPTLLALVRPEPERDLLAVRREPRLGLARDRILRTRLERPRDRGGECFIGLRSRQGFFGTFRSIP